MWSESVKPQSRTPSVEEELSPAAETLLLQSFSEIRNRYGNLQRNSRQADLPHSVIIPHATYAPWRNDAPFLRYLPQIKSHTKVDEYRLHELWQLVAQGAMVPGDLLEVGVWRGGSGVILAGAMVANGIQSTLYLADTFSGIVKAGERDTRYKGGEHADTSEQVVTTLLTEMGLTQYVILKGIFPDETGQDIADHRFRFCHIDVDVYQSGKDVFEWIWPRLSVGGIVVFDDYGFSGCEGITRFANELINQSDLVFIHNLNGHAILIKLK